MREHHDTPTAPAAAAAPNAMRGNNRAVNGNPGQQDNNRSNFNGQNASRPDSNNAMRGNPGRQDNNRSNFNGQNANRPDSNNAMRGNPGRQDNNRSNFNGQNSGNPNNAARGGPNGGQRHDFSGARNFHQNFDAQRRFHAPSYRRPQGYYARRWSWGQVLPSAFWARDYWLSDYYDYDLPPPPFGAIWVRVGNDALLIDQDSGEIIEVDYGVFY